MAFARRAIAEIQDKIFLKNLHKKYGERAFKTTHKWEEKRLPEVA